MLVRLIFFLLLVVFSSACERETERRDDYLIEGVDVSRYQSRVDWAMVADQGMDFAFVKATEGATYSDSLFGHNWEQIKAAGMRRGAYHFYRPNTAAVDQANHFVAQVSLSEGDLPPVLDIEVLDRVNPKILVPALKTWLVLITRHYGVRPIVYTNLNFYNRYLAGHLDEYPLWIARYNGAEPVLACGRDWQFWQYGNRGTVAGIDGPVDLNVFAGDRVEFEELAYTKETALSEAH